MLGTLRVGAYRGSSRLGVGIRMRTTDLRTVMTGISCLSCRLYSTQNSTKAREDALAARRSKTVSRMFPGFMKHYAARFAQAPLEHTTAFLILHEMTAIIPFCGMWWAFYKFGGMPMDIPAFLIEKGSKFIDGILGQMGWEAGVEDKSKLVLTGAASYAVVKAAFPLRLFVSVTLMPWFARIFVVPSFRGLKSIGELITGGGRKKGELNAKLSPTVKKKEVKKVNLDDEDMKL